MTLEKLFDKLESISEKQAEMNEILAKQEVQLSVHIARTDALEALVQLHYEEIHDQLEPVKDHVSMLKGASKLVALVLSIAGVTAAFLKVFWTN